MIWYDSEPVAKVLVAYLSQHKYPSNEGAEQPYDLECLIAFCAWLNLLVRKHQESPVNCLAQFVNCVSAPMPGEVY